MPHCNVSISWDLAIALHPPMMHKTPGAMDLELPATHFWPPGFGSHKMSSTVLHRGMCISLEGHDLGRFIVHVPIGPLATPLLPLVMFSSSRNANFSAPMVKLNQESAACCILFNWPPMPMTSCAEPIALPITCTPTSHFNSLRVGVSWTSYLISVLTLAANLLIERYLLKRDQALKDLNLDDDKIKSIVGGSTLYGLINIKDSAAFLLKSVVATASGVARLTLTDETGTFKFLDGGPFGLEVSRAADGTYGIKGSVRLGSDAAGATLSAGGATDGSREVGIKLSEKVSDGTKNALDENNKNENALNFSVKKDANDTFKYAGSASQKQANGTEVAVGGTREVDAKGQVTDSVTASGKDALGNEAELSHERSTDQETVNTTSTSKLNAKHAFGSHEASTNDVRNESTQVVEKQVKSSSTRPAQNATYPETPNLGPNPTPSPNSGPLIA